MLDPRRPRGRRRCLAGSDWRVPDDQRYSASLHALLVCGWPFEYLLWRSVYSSPLKWQIFSTQNILTDLEPVWTLPISPQWRGRHRHLGPLPRTWLRTGGARERLVLSPGPWGPPRATFPAAPGSPGFSVVAAVARTRGQRFLTVWVTAARPQDGINWMGQNYPSLFLLFTLLSGKHPLQNHQGPLLRPSWDQGLLTTTNAN